MVYDFEKITLSMKEKYKLFVTRMRKKSKAEYFGDSEYYLSDIKFIRQNSSGKTDIHTRWNVLCHKQLSSLPNISQGKIFLTSAYFRYHTYSCFNRYVHIDSNNPKQTRLKIRITVLYLRSLLYRYS